MSDHMTTYFHVEDAEESIEAKAEFLRGNAWCVIGVFEVMDGHNLESAKVFKGVERVLNNAVIIFGGQGSLVNVDTNGMGQKMTFLEVLPDSKVLTTHVTVFYKG